MAYLKKNPGPFFRGIMESDRADEMMKVARAMVELNDRRSISDFIRSFYTDPDPRTEDLKKIGCPVLIIHGEKDDLFIQSSRLMAEHIGNAILIEYPGAGHMTAIEAAGRLSCDLSAFFGKNPV